MSHYFAGVIILANIEDHQGKAKNRRAIVINHDEAAKELYVVPISATKDLNKPFYHILIHDSDRYDHETSLSAVCWAKCNWFTIVKESTVKRRCGVLNSELLDQIVDCIDRLESDENFDDWVHPEAD